MHRYWFRWVLALAVASVAAPSSAQLATASAEHSFATFYYKYRLGVFTAVPLGRRDIVFLGDSLTEGGEWNELFPGLPVRDRGIGGDSTEGVLARLDSITAARPRAIFLMIGTNDLGAQLDPAASLARYHEILLRIRRDAPSTRVFVQSLLPRPAAYRERIEAYNRALQGFSREMGFTYIDLYPAFLAPDGALRAELTFDGVHLSGAGYRRWQSLLAPHLASLDRR